MQLMMLDVSLCCLRRMLKFVDQIIENPGNTDSQESTENTAQINHKTDPEMSLAGKYSKLQLNSQALQDEVRRLSERMNNASSSQAPAPQNVLPTAVNRLPQVTSDNKAWKTRWKCPKNPEKCLTQGLAPRLAQRLTLHLMLYLHPTRDPDTRPSS